MGDSPLIGCGCYADDFSAGASATGWGESIMKVVLCKAACDFAAHGYSAQAAAEKAIGVLADRAQGLGGLIVIDRPGQIGVSFNTPRMARAWVDSNQIVAQIAQRVESVTQERSLMMNAVFRQRLKTARSDYVGTIVSLASPEVAEVLSGQPVLTGSSSMPNTARWMPLSIQRLVQGAGSTPCLVRLASGDEVSIKKALDVGAAGVIAPHGELGRAGRDKWCAGPSMHRWAHAASALAARTVMALSFRSMCQQANEETVVVVQAEHIDAVNNMEAIVQVPGVDAVLVGPYDLSASLGRLGEVTASRSGVCHRACDTSLSGRAHAAGNFRHVGGSGEAVHRTRLYLDHRRNRHGAAGKCGAGDGRQNQRTGTSRVLEIFEVFRLLLPRLVHQFQNRIDDHCGSSC